MQNVEGSMEGKTCVITGTTSGIGKETALALARRGASVLMVARDQERGQAAAAEIRQRAPQGSVELLVADLASQADVRRLAAQILAVHDRVDVLVNNAGVAKFERQLTPEGLEVMFATNHLAPFLLTHLLLTALEHGAPSRVVNVASDIHSMVRAIPWDDMQAERRFSGFRHYALTKLMNVLFTYELAERVKGSGVTVNCLTPGHLDTRLGRDARGPFALFLLFSRLWMSSAEQGSETSVFLASSPDVASVSGRYFGRCRPKESSKLSHDRRAARRLWELSVELSGLVGSM